MHVGTHVHTRIFDCSILQATALEQSLCSVASKKKENQWCNMFTSFTVCLYVIKIVWGRGGEGGAWQKKTPLLNVMYTSTHTDKQTSATKYDSALSLKRIKRQFYVQYAGLLKTKAESSQIFKNCH